jgi:ankyrin repeat protein
MADDLMMDPGEEEEEKPEPRIFKPDLYEAAMNNDTQKVFTYLEEKVPPTHVDEQSGWTPLHWAAKHGNVQMTHLLIEFGATAPYHRMVAAAKKAQEKAEADAAAAAKKESGGGFVVPELKEEDGEGAGGSDEKTSEDDKFEGGGAAEDKKTDSDAAAGDAGADAKAGGATAADSKTADDKKDDDAAQDTAPSGEAGSKEGGAAVADSKAAGVVDEKKGDNTDAAAAAAAAAADVEEEDEDDMDYETAMDRKAETSVDLTKNTPLLWAAASGHLRVVWLLLQAGYDPNNLDDLENNSLHLAACGGNAKVCRVLIDSGAMSTLVNTYKNLPIDMALGSEIRDIVSDAMIKGASMTAADIATKHVANMERYAELTNKLEVIIKKAEKQSGNSPEAISETIASLMDAISESKHWGLDLTSIEKGEMLVKKLEMGQVLSSEVKVVEAHAPIRSQAQYKEFVSRLEGAIVDARTLGLDEDQISACEAVVRRAGLEFWVCVLTDRLKSVECATDTDEHDLRRLEQAITKGLDAGAADSVVDKAQELCKF